MTERRTPLSLNRTSFNPEVTTRLRASRPTLLMAFVLGLVAPESPAQVQAERWAFTATLRETLTDNLFLIPADGPGESITGATLNLSWQKLDDANLLSAVGWTNGSVYNRFDTYNGLSWGGGLFVQHDFTTRARGRASLAYADGLNLEALYAGRVGLPGVDVKTGVATADFSYKLSRGTVGSASLDATGIRYRAETLLTTARLPGDGATPPDLLAPLDLDTLPGVPQPPEATLAALALLASESLRAYRLDYWTWHAATRLEHEFTPKTSATLGAGYRRTGQEPETFSFGDQLELNAGMRHVIDSGASLSLTYLYQENRFDPPTRTHSIVGQAVKEFSTKVSGDLSLGASYLDSGSASVSGWDLVGGVGLTARLKRTSLGVRYSRSRYQALVLGRTQTVDLFDASLARTLRRRVYLSIYGYYRDARDPLDDLYSYDTALVGASAAARIGKRGTVGVSYGFRHFQTGRLPGADRSIVSVFLRYTRPFK